MVINKYFSLKHILKKIFPSEIENLKRDHELEKEELWQKNSDLKIDHVEKLKNLVSQNEKGRFNLRFYILFH